MPVDPNTFFREATLRLLGNLEIEQGLRACVEYFARYIPADKVYLERSEPELAAMRMIARATKDHGERMDVLVPYNKEARQAMAQLADVWRAGELPPVLVINNPCEEPVTRCMLQGLNEPWCSAMSLPLIIEDKIVGALALLAEGDNRYTEEHARLYSMLKDPFFVAMSNTLKHREVLKLKDLISDDNRYLHNELRRLSGDEIIGSNFGLSEVMKQVMKVAPMNSPVLLLGETGVGKDVIANAIHYSSARSDGPFVSVNCGAIPDTLIDSELFGHEKGAFTGALAQKRGRFERAHKGTIFLDEIGELPLPAQVRLLKVLQSKEIERVGGVKTIALDIRIIAATNRNLEEMVENGRFRQDLWFRLNVFPVHIPPLRERLSDIPALLQHFIDLKCRELKLSAIPLIAPGAIDNLMAYPWPGNVRELENVVERALILNPAGPLTFEHLSLHSPGEQMPVTKNKRVLYNLDELLKSHIRLVLEMTNGKIHGADGAAAILGVNASTLRNRMKKLGIKFGRLTKK